MGRKGEEPRVTQLVNIPREVEEPLLFETPSREVEAPLFFQTPPLASHEERRRNRIVKHGTNSNPCPLRMKQAEGEFSTAPGRTFEEAKQCWHDEKRPNTFASVVKDENVPRRRQANMSISRSIVRKLGIWDRSEDAWDPATAHHLTGSVGIKPTSVSRKRFQGPLPVSNMSASGGMSVSRASAVEAGQSQPTLRVGALPQATFRQNWCPERAAIGRSVPKS